MKRKGTYSLASHGDTKCTLRWTTNLIQSTLKISKRMIEKTLLDSNYIIILLIEYIRAGIPFGCSVHSCPLVVGKYFLYKIEECALTCWMYPGHMYYYHLLLLRAHHKFVLQILIYNSYVMITIIIIIFSHTKDVCSINFTWCSNKPVYYLYILYYCAYLPYIIYWKVREFRLISGNISTLLCVHIWILITIHDFLF